MKYLLRLLIVFLFQPFAFAEKSEIDQIVLWDRNYHKPYHLDVIKLLLESSRAEYGDFDIAPSVHLEQGRVFAEINAGSLVNVAIAATSSEREQQHTPIYFPLDRGLLGFRICLVNNGKVSLEGINVLRDFNKRNILLGVGAHWPDKQVYEANGLRVLSSPLYENLFDMLEKRRFDCLPRSISELDIELQNHRSQNFVAETSIALVYPNADFLFVSEQYSQLRERLNAGLDKALKNGDFQALFKKYYAEIMIKYDFYGRKLLILENPNLPEPAQKAINQYGVATFLRAD